MYEWVVKAVSMAVVYFIENAFREDDAKENFILHAERLTGVDLVSSFYTDEKLIDMLEKRRRLRDGR